MTRTNSLLLLLTVSLAFAFSYTPMTADAAPFKGKFKFTSKAPKEDIFGTAKGSADLSISTADLTKITGTITVPVAKMETGNATRDEHLRGEQWLNAAKHPNITFKIAKSEVTKPLAKDDKGVSVAELKVTGEFSLHGHSITLTAPATVKVKDGKAKVTTTFNIELAKFKIAGSEGTIGSKVGKSIACEATLVGSIQ